MQESNLADRSPASVPDTNRLLIVDDDEPFRLRLARAMERRGFYVETAGAIADAAAAVQRLKPTHAVLDLRLSDGSGLDIVAILREARPECRIVMLTAYGNIATAVAAVKEIGRAHV